VQVQHAFSSVPRIAGLRRHVLKYLVQTVRLLRHNRRNPQQDSHRRRSRRNPQQDSHRRRNRRNPQQDSHRRRNRLNTQQQGSHRRHNHHSEVIHSTHTIIPTP
jgi:hypothetical protein